jgi:A/G-specific adenine glycosylase
MNGSTLLETAHLERAHSSIFTWIVPRLRQLPWRDVRDPWRILVSEVMLQQTSVHRVIGKWESFIGAFPTPDECAQAELGDVLRLWQGLGYPRRARNLHMAAQVIVSEFDGRVPDSLESLLSLPGVGPYTARAVLAFAYEAEAAVVDVNVLRVLRRLVGEPIGMRSAQELADNVLPDGESWLWNQALMDLGATVCRPRPDCDQCPLHWSCAWRGHGPDPAVGTASSPQARFEGSGRQARGKLLKALGARPLHIDEAAVVMGRPPHIADDLVQALLNEGLIRRVGDQLQL